MRSDRKWWLFRHRWFMAIIGVVGLVLIGLESFMLIAVAPLRPISEADKVTLYSIDGNDYPTEMPPPKTAERFHDFPVLGKLDISKRPVRDEVLSSISKGVVNNGLGGGAKCFWPRHGIRAERNGEVTDYVICFECEHVKVYRKSERERWIQITSEPQALLDGHLKRGGIALAPRKEEIAAAAEVIYRKARPGKD